MDMRQIQYFLTVAKHKNFTAAAASLDISQSTLSRQITAMEKELNLLLFLRDNRNVRLTDCGAYLYSEYARLYEQYVKITRNAQDIFQGFSGNIKFGILEEITLEGKLQDIFYDFHMKFPNQIIDMRRGSFKELADGITTLELDFIVTFFFDISHNTAIEYRIIEDAVHGIIVSGKNPLSGRKRLSFADLKEETFIILSEEDSPLASTGAINHCMAHGFYPKLKFAPNLDTAMLWVEAGLGIAFTYSKSIAAHNPSMTFIPFCGEDQIAESKMVLAWNSGNSNPAIHNFIKLLDPTTKKSGNAKEYHHRGRSFNE